MAILIKVKLLPSGEVALGRVCRLQPAGLFFKSGTYYVPLFLQDLTLGLSVQTQTLQSNLLEKCRLLLLFYQQTDSGLDVKQQKIRQTNNPIMSFHSSWHSASHVAGHPLSAQESKEMRSLHQRGRETKNFHFPCSPCLCFRG